MSHSFVDKCTSQTPERSPYKPGVLGCYAKYVQSVYHSKSMWIEFTECGVRKSTFWNPYFVRKMFLSSFLVLGQCNSHSWSIFMVLESYAKIEIRLFVEIFFMKWPSQSGQSSKIEDNVKCNQIIVWIQTFMIRWYFHFVRSHE